MYWERCELYGPWEAVPDHKVPASVVRRWNRRVRNWGTQAPKMVPVVPAHRYYYRLRFCV